MLVLLSNLVARTPTVEDLSSIEELVAACDSADYGIADSPMRDLASRWQHSSFHLESDAWVIVNGRKQFAGFACVWHQDHEEFSTFICVHPQYRKRGIGTLLLRVAEQHARELMRPARPGTRVSLRGTVSAKNAQACRLFEREGYLSIREFWRVTLEPVESSGDGISHPGKFVFLESLPGFCCQVPSRLQSRNSRADHRIVLVTIKVIAILFLQEGGKQSSPTL